MIDDLGSDSDEFETNVRRIAQRARNVGIHLVVATQRPSANIINTDLRSNLDMRAAFRVPTDTDSQIILAETFLRAESEEPQYYWNFDDVSSEQQSIYNFWKDRWVSKRVQKEWILNSIRDFDRDEFLLSNHFEDQYNETFSRYQE